MKHAYLFTANGNLKVLASCLRMLDYPSNDFYIIFDRKSSRNIDLLKSILSKIEKADVKYLGLKTVNWGAQVDAVMDLIDSAIKSGVNTNIYISCKILICPSRVTVISFNFLTITMEKNL